MKIHQLSMFLENKPGRLSEPCRLLANAGINILTLSLADTQQFGILRIIVHDWEKARKVLEGAGADAVVLFNRFYQPDLDIEALEVEPSLSLSTNSTLRLRLRWLAVLHSHIGMTMTVSGGVHSGESAIKATMAGATGIQLVSALLMHGPERLKAVREGMAQWMEEHEYESLDQMRGSLSLLKCPNPQAFERANYMRVLAGWKA